MYISSLTLSNQVAMTRFPEGVVASFHQALRGIAEMWLSQLTKNEDYKQPALVEGIGGHPSRDQLSEKTNDDLPILFRTLGIFAIITSLVHLRDQAMYVFSTIDTIRISSATSCCAIWRVTFSVGQSSVNPHLPSGVSFLGTREYLLPGVMALQHRRWAMSGVSRLVVV